MSDDEQALHPDGAVYARILRHIATQANDDEAPEGFRSLPEILEDLAQAFERAGGIEYEADQAEGLKETLGLLRNAMASLSESARESGHDQAAAKMEWAANQSFVMAMTVRSGEAGTVALSEPD